MPKGRKHGDGGLYPIRGGKLWRGVVDGGLGPDGQRIQWQVHASTRTACASKLNTLRAEIAQHGAPLGRSVRLAEFAEHWLETVALPDVDPKTYQGYASNVRRWIIPTIGARKVADLTPADVRALRKAMTDAGRKTSTMRGAHIVLSQILDAAVGERLCRTNVAKDVRKPGARKVVVKADERGSFTTEQAIAILQAAAEMPDGAGARWWFKLLVGQRQGEILGATLADLDLAAWEVVLDDGSIVTYGTYTVNWKLEELRRRHGCGDEPCRFKQGARCPQAQWIIPDDFERVHLTGAWHLTRPKSQTGRVPPLIPQLVKAMSRHLAATDHLPNPHGLIWHDGTGNPILPRQDAEEWRALLVRAGVITEAEAIPGGPMTGHWARHTTVTILASLGVDFQVIGEIVGHSSTQVTAIYRHAQAAEKRAAVDKLGQAFAIGLAPKAIGP